MRTALVLACTALLAVAFVPAEVRAGACAGVCQDNSNACPSPYQSGLCPGGATIQCCPEATPACGQGQCQDNSLPCSTSYASGLCPGASNIQCCIAGQPSGPTGIDIAVPIDSQTASCFASQGYTQSWTRAWHSTGSFDSNAPGSLAALSGAGLNADVYLFPCSFGQDAAYQVQTMTSSLQSAGAAWNMTWLDIEDNPSSSCDWSSTDFASNCDYVQQLIDAVQASGHAVGVYTSTRIWGLFFGGTGACTNFSANAVPLWYPRYNGDPTCNAFVPFAGWTNPTWHQWAGDATVCGIDVDLNTQC